MPKPYKAAIIGLGMIGGADQVSGDALGQQVSGMDGTHAASLANNPDIDLIAGSSRDAGRRERFEQRNGAKTYDSWREMLEKESLDIVSVATYAPSHAEITVGCADAGVRSIYCEKPVATRLSNAERMLSACKISNTLLVINHQRRFNLNHRRLRDLIADGGLGDLTSASIQWSSGRLGNVGTHVLDALLMLTGQRAHAVSATLDLSGKPDCRGPQFSDPGVWGTLRMDSGLMVSLNAPDYALTPFRTELNGSDRRVIIGAKDITLESWDGQQEHWAHPEDGISGMDRAVAEIVDHLDTGSPFPYDAKEAVHTLEIIVACHASHARNAVWTEIPPSGTDLNRVVHTG